MSSSAVTFLSWASLISIVRERSDGFPIRRSAWTDRPSGRDKAAHPDGPLHAAPPGHESRAPRASMGLAVRVEPAIADMGRAARPSRAGPAPTGSLPSRPRFLVDRMAISGLIRTVRGAVWSKRSASVQAGVAALARRLEDHDPQGHMDLGGGQAGAIGVHHGFDHVIDQTADFRGPWDRRRGRQSGPERDGPCGRFSGSMAGNMGIRRGRRSKPESVNSSR